jgi:4-amino-4-deoxy-L-arabinose transferase-like glycosyltransferase
LTYLEAHQGSATYLVATFGSQSSAPIIIASGKPVVTIGGFNGGDPAPTLTQLQQMVAKGQLRYVLIQGNGGGFGGPGGNSSAAITSWVTSKGKEVTIASSSGAQAGGTLYDVSGAA